MSKWFYSVSRLLTLVSCVAGLSQAVQAGEFSVANRDEVLVLTSRIQATQFLTHATFGASQADIDALATSMRTSGTIAAASAWIDAQTAVAYNAAVSGHSTLERSYVDFDLQFASLYNRSGVAPPSNYTYTPNGSTVSHRNAFNRTRYRQNAWWHRVLAGNDQLRQKMAWALAQILAVGENAVGFNEEEPDSTVTGGPTPVRHNFHGLADYYDIFVRNAFGSYRTVLGHVTYHGIMGDWLSFRGNKKQSGTGSNTIYPDENYAREVMQLFSIGLDVLNDDGTPTTNPISATYDADDIREYAQVFTGLGYGYGTLNTGSTTANPYSPYTAGTSADPNANRKYAAVPMRMAPDDHDTSSKVLLNGLTLTAIGGTLPSDLASEAIANAEIDAALTGLFNHPTCPPFICNKLIQRFVKSNPSRAYVTRVVNVFKNNGSGGRGDLKAVVKAILLDPEAWQPIRVQFQRSPAKFIVTTMGTEDSRLQEPVLSYTRFTRFFKATSEYQIGLGGSNATLDPFIFESTVPSQFRLNTTDPTFDQAPYSQPSVFNFYVSDYQSPDIALYTSTSGRMQRGTAIFAPEFQIVNAITSNNTGNLYRTLSSGAPKIETYLTFNQNPNNLPVAHPNYSTQYENSANVTNVTTKSTRTVVSYDMSLEWGLLTLAAGFNNTDRDTAVDKLLDHLDLYLCGGTLNQGFKTSIRNATITEMDTAASGGVTTAEATNIVRGALMAILSSPSFLVTE